MLKRTLIASCCLLGLANVCEAAKPSSSSAFPVTVTFEELTQDRFFSDGGGTYGDGAQDTSGTNDAKTVLFFKYDRKAKRSLGLDFSGTAIQSPFASDRNLTDWFSMEVFIDFDGMAVGETRTVGFIRLKFDVGRDTYWIDWLRDQDFPTTVTAGPDVTGDGIPDSWFVAASQDTDAELLLIERGRRISQGVDCIPFGFVVERK